MLNLASVLPQVEEMAEHVAADEGGASTLPRSEIYRILQDQKELREAHLAAFKARYGVVWTRETFTREQPGADVAFVLTPDNGDPLPPIDCHVKVHGYHGEVWQTVVMDIDELAGTYTAKIVEGGEQNKPFTTE